MKKCYGNPRFICSVLIFAPILTSKRKIGGSLFSVIFIFSQHISPFLTNSQKCTLRFNFWPLSRSLSHKRCGFGQGECTPPSGRPKGCRPFPGPSSTHVLNQHGRISSDDNAGDFPPALCTGQIAQECTRIIDRDVLTERSHTWPPYLSTDVERGRGPPQLSVEGRRRVGPTATE
jgi:hypothetical protein